LCELKGGGRSTRDQDRLVRRLEIGECVKKVVRDLGKGGEKLKYQIVDE
jgi:hypothetical protein